MSKRRNFTLVELLIVVGIIAILAGLVIPAVSFAQQRGRITAAKSDMTAILMALKGVQTTYGKMIKEDSTFGHHDRSGDIKTVRFSDSEEDNYNKLIAELTIPGDSALTSLNINKRKIKFLEPKPNFDPTKAYNSDDNKKHLWRDPWGKPYVIIINCDGESVIPNPADTYKNLATQAVVYSCGPNGDDNQGKNVEVDVGSPQKTDDDIASWHK